MEAEEKEMEKESAKKEQDRSKEVIAEEEEEKASIEKGEKEEKERQEKFEEKMANAFKKGEKNAKEPTVEDLHLDASPQAQLSPPRLLPVDVGAAAIHVPTPDEAAAPLNNMELSYDKAAFTDDPVEPDDVINS